MRAHKLDAYIDGRKRIIFCSVCGQEDAGLGEECFGEPVRYMKDRKINGLVIKAIDNSIKSS